MIVRGESALGGTVGDAERAAKSRSPIRAVALPAEHGGWGLTLEPVVLGLIVAPSLAGLALGLAALVAFVARTPLKVVLVDRFRDRVLDRTRLAARIVAGELFVLAGLLGTATVLASGRFWIPLVIALPLLGLELWFDMRSRSRRLLPEFAGTTGIGSVAAAIVLAGSGSTETAAGVWLLVTARAIASLPFVRFQLQRAKDQSARVWEQDLAQGGAVALAVGGVALGWLPWPAAVAIGILALVQLVLARVPPPKAVIVGVQETLLGLAVVIAVGIAIHLG